jgi:hypothetical protein
MDASSAGERLSSVVEGIGGMAAIVVALLTPMLRGRRTCWGLARAEADASWPGDDLVPTPRWGWTHAIEIGAPADEVWPWVAQIGLRKAGFYSYTAIENAVGCGIVNADRIHPEWTRVSVGDDFRLHPAMLPMTVARVEEGRWFVARAGGPAGPNCTVEVSWLFHVAPLGTGRSRFSSRFRCRWSGGGLGAALAFGPTLDEPIGFVMDRRMLRGVRERIQASRAAT